MKISYFMGLPVWLAELLVMVGWFAAVALICWGIDRLHEGRGKRRK